MNQNGLKKFVYVHVPKCGGITFRTAIDRLYGDLACNDESFKMHRRWGMVSFKYVPKYHARYYPFGPVGSGGYRVIYGHFLAEKYKHLGWPIITIIRDPVERVISNFSVWRRIGKDQKLHKMKKSWSIRTYAEHNTNVMTRMLGTSLDIFEFVGVQERYNESIRKIGEILDLCFPTDVGIHNKTDKKVKVSQEDRKYIESLNKLDRQLYQNVIKRYF